MSVALVSTPDLLALTKGGRMVYQFSGSGRYQTTGLSAISLLFLAAAVPDGTILNLTWNGVTHSLVFKDAPSAPNEFTTGDGTDAYADALLAQLESYYPIREDFTLTRNEPNTLPGVILTARQPGKAYTITVNLPVGTPFGFGNTVFGADPILRTQYSVYAELWLQKVGTAGTDLNAHYERIFAPMIETDVQGNATWDIGTVLHTRLTADWPLWAAPVPLPAQHSQRKYYVCYGEAWGAPMQVGRVVRDSVRQAYLGGSDYQRRAGGALAFLHERTSDRTLDAALRFGPTLRYVRQDEPQFLTFLNSRDREVGVLLKVIRTFDNDSTDTFIDIAPQQQFEIGQKITYAVGATVLHLFENLPTGRTLKEYSVQLITGGGLPLILAYRYILNYDYQPYTRYFAYLNSLGAVETLTTFGKGSRELNRFFDQAEHYLPALYEVADGQFVDYNLSVQQQVEVTTGFRSESELRAWTDFYRSPSRFRLADGRALPISIASKSIQQAKDGDTLFAHKFQYIYLYRDDFYSETSSDVATAGTPPPGFTPGGGVTIQPVQVVPSVDPTVPDAVRELTAPIINGFKQAVAWGNHALAGYLTQTTGSALFRRKDQQVDYVNDLVNAPTTQQQLEQLSVLAPNLRYRLGIPVGHTQYAGFSSGDFSTEDFNA